MLFEKAWAESSKSFSYAKKGTLLIKGQELLPRIDDMDYQNKWKTVKSKTHEKTFLSWIREERLS